jgi:hypothetical protein
MLSRFLAILLLVLLTVLPAAGGAMAFPGAEHCAPAAHAMPMEHSGHGEAAKTDCDHGGSHRQLPCAMMGMCPMTGCMALMGITAPEGVALGQPVSFRHLDALRVDGLALAPLLEPPRA